MLCRLLAWAALAGAGYALVAAPAAARQDKSELPDRPAGLFEDVNKYRREGLTDLKKAQAAFARFADYHARLIGSPALYAATKDFRPDPKVPALDKVIDDLAGRVAVPEPGSKVGTESVAYIRELGAAMDAALAKVVDDEGADRIARINAARLLAAAARSGAPAHYPTVTRLIEDPKTPPEVKVYALKAAEGLLAAYDPAASIVESGTRNVVYQTRKHSVPNDVLVKLVGALDRAVTDPALLLPGVPPGSAVGALPPEQQAVALYLRRQAVRALAQVRFPSVAGTDETVVYPAHTLARIALGDSALVPPPYNPRPAPPEMTKKDEVDAWLAAEGARRVAAAGRRAAEAAEAVLGLCNIAPAAGYSVDLAADAVAAGLIAFAGPRIANPADRSVGWRTYAVRLDDALKQWQTINSPGYDPQRPTAKGNLRPAPAAVRRVVEAATKDGGLLPQIERVGPDGRPEGNPRVDELAAIRADLRKAENRSRTLFQDVPRTALDFQPPAPPAPPAKKK